VLDQLRSSTDKAAAERTMRAMLEMGKLDIQALQAAYSGKTAVEAGAPS
jgi:hypothetical protein